MKKKILIISTGGTISCGETEQGLSPKLKFDELLSNIPSLDCDAKIDGVQLMNIDSGNIHPTNWLDIANQIKKEYNNYDGFVITHGTDTLSYTSAALSYLVQNSKKPIVLTGSQKPIEVDDSDGKNNLSKSIVLACQGVGGVFIVFNNKVILGTEAKKTKSKSYDAFVSLNVPYVAYFEDDKLYWNEKILELLETNYEQVQFYDSLDTKVALIKIAPGLKPDILVYIAEHYHAVVIEAYGVGSIPFDEKNDYVSAIELISHTGCIVVVVSQALNQGTFMQRYEIGRKALYLDNVIEGGLLSTECAVTKLMWAMGQTHDKEEIVKLVNMPVALDKMKI